MGRRGGVREPVWKAIRQMREFTLLDLTGKLKQSSEETIKDYLNGLRRAGFVESTGFQQRGSGQPGRRTVYKLVNDVGVDAPRVRRDGSLLPAPGRERLWQAARILKAFSVTDLVATASLLEAPVSLEEAKTYALFLCRAGYLFEVEAGRRYQFLPSTYSGPKAPYIRRTKEVVDANTGEVRWTAVQEDPS